MFASPGLGSHVSQRFCPCKETEQPPGAPAACRPLPQRPPPSRGCVSRVFASAPPFCTCPCPAHEPRALRSTVATFSINLVHNDVFLPNDDSSSKPSSLVEFFKELFSPAPSASVPTFVFPRSVRGLWRPRLLLCEPGHLSDTGGLRNPQTRVAGWLCTTAHGRVLLM